MPDPAPTKIVVSVHGIGEAVIRSKEIFVSTDQEVDQLLPYDEPPAAEIRRYLSGVKRFSIVVWYDNGLVRDWIPNRV